MGAIAGSAASDQKDVLITMQGFEDRDGFGDREVHGTSSTDDELWWHFHHEKRPRKEAWNQEWVRREFRAMTEDSIKEGFMRGHQDANKRGPNIAQLAVRL